MLESRLVFDIVIYSGVFFLNDDPWEKSLYWKKAFQRLPSRHKEDFRDHWLRDVRASSFWKFTSFSQRLRDPKKFRDTFILYMIRIATRGHDRNVKALETEEAKQEPLKRHEHRCLENFGGWMMDDGSWIMDYGWWMRMRANVVFSGLSSKISKFGSPALATVCAQYFDQYWHISHAC